MKADTGESEIKYTEEELHIKSKAYKKLKDVLVRRENYLHVSEF